EPQALATHTLPLSEMISLDLDALANPASPEAGAGASEGVIVETIRKPAEPPRLSSSSELPEEDALTPVEVKLHDPREFTQLDEPEGDPTEAAALDEAQPAGDDADEQVKVIGPLRIGI